METWKTCFSIITQNAYYQCEHQKRINKVIINGKVYVNPEFICAHDISLDSSIEASFIKFFIVVQALSLAKMIMRTLRTRT